MMDWPKFRYAEVLPNRPESIAERHSRVRREYGDYVRRQYGLGKRRWSADTSALMRLSGDCCSSSGGAFRSVAINCRVRNEIPVQRGEKEKYTISEAVKQMLVSSGTPGVPREGIPKEVPKETTGGEFGEVCAVTSSESNSVADGTGSAEIVVKEPPVEKQASVELSAVEDETILEDPPVRTWFGSLTSWFKTTGASEVPSVGTVEEAPKSPDDGESGDLGENCEDSTPDGSGKIVTKGARCRRIAAGLYRESVVFLKNLIRETLEWMISAVDWFVGRGQFGFIDDFGGFRK